AAVRPIDISIGRWARLPPRQRPLLAGARSAGAGICARRRRWQFLRSRAGSSIEVAHCRPSGTPAGTGERSQSAGAVLQQWHVGQRPLCSDAIKLAVRADEELALRHGDARTGAVVPFISHSRGMEELEAVAGANHEHVTTKIHDINLVVRSGG